MFWQETEKPAEFVVSRDVVDLSFGLKGLHIPLDHRHALSEAIIQQLPWIVDEPQAAIHEIHVVTSGNGWMRPEDEDNECLVMSRRTRMTIRLPAHRVIEAREQLPGKTLQLDEYEVEVGNVKLKPLSQLTTLFTRDMVCEADEPEMEFLQRVASDLKDQYDIKIRKLLCGTAASFKHPDLGRIHTKHIMLADLTQEQSVALQQGGLGPHRLLGCGIFLPHRGIDAVFSE